MDKLHALMQPAPKVAKTEMSVFEKKHEAIMDFVDLDEHANPLRKHQRVALRRIRDWFAPESEDKDETCVVVMPTGSGKTGVAVCAPYVLAAHKCMVLAPSPKLASDLMRAFCGSETVTDSFLCKLGFEKHEFSHHYSPQEFMLNSQKNATQDFFEKRDLIVTNVHKFPGDSGWEKVFPMNIIDLLIVDEAHHFPASFWERVVTVAKGHSTKVGVVMV